MKIVLRWVVSLYVEPQCRLITVIIDPAPILGLAVIAKVHLYAKYYYLVASSTASFLSNQRSAFLSARIVNNGSFK